MGLLDSLFGKSKAPPEPQSEDYNGFRITPAPMQDGAVFRLSAVIEKDVAGQTQSHTLIRADTFSDADSARDASLVKAKQMIDAQGERIFTP